MAVRGPHNGPYGSWVRPRVRYADRSPVAGTMIDAPVRLAGCGAVPDFGAPALGFAEWYPKLTGGLLAGILYQVPVSCLVAQASR